MTLSKTTNLLLLLIIITYILIVTQSLLIPLVLSILVWYLIKEIRDFIRQNRFIREKLPMWLQNLVVFGLIFMVFGILSKVISAGVYEILGAIPTYEKNIDKIIAQLQADYDINAWTVVNDYSGRLTKMLESFIGSLVGILGNSFLVIIYCIFLLIEEGIFRKKFTKLFENKKHFEKMDSILDQIDKSFSRYFFLKTLVSLLTAVLSFIVLIIIGVDAPILWCTIIFMLNYIPNIGSLVATLLPTFIAMLQFGEIRPGLIVLAGVGAAQWFVANVIEPRIMGNSLNISPFVVILALIIWNAIWGVAGMFLSVPVTVMMIIIFAQFESTKGVALMLSENGEVD